MSEPNEGASNAINPKVIQGYFRLARDKLGELESLKGTYMADCKVLREDLKDIKGRAKESGIPLKVFNAGLKRIALEAAIEKIPANLDEDDADLYDMTLDAVLGDYVGTPLGQAAVAAEAANNDSPKTMGQKRAAARSAAADSLTEDDADAKAAASNAAALTNGISKLN